MEKFNVKIFLMFTNKFRHFVVNKPSAKVCEMDVSEENFQSLKYAVDNHYWYQMYIGMFSDYYTFIA